MAMNKFMERKIEAEILGELYEKLENDLKYATKSYERIGKETEQARDYKTGELLWEDDEQTIPKFRDNWDYVDVPEDKLSDEAKLKIKVIKSLMIRLEKM